ncbi:MAG: ADP-ribosyl-[dinitrogen reductase] hydrolase [Candidatus Deferrimicrobiaceae bacterium]
MSSSGRADIGPDRPLPPAPGDLLDRARAAFLGVAVGDALGATTEFMTPKEIRDKHGVHDQVTGGGWLRLKPGQVTDDTEMSLCIARAVCDTGGWNLRAVADAFAGWLRGRPADVGATCRHGIRDYMLKGRLEAPPNDGDAGNGAVMRMAPVALLTLGDGEALDRLAAEQAHLTHNHPLSDAACRCVGRMVHRGVSGTAKEKLYEEARGLATVHPAFRFEPYRGEASAYVVHTLQTVFHHFFGSSDFEECLVRIVNQGGDADTTGAIGGMIAGAFYGTSAIPGKWLRKLDETVRSEAEAHAVRLARMSPLLASASPRRNAEMPEDDEGRRGR